MTFNYLSRTYFSQTDVFPWAMQLIFKLTDFCVLLKECVTPWWNLEKRILSSECGRLYLSVSILTQFAGLGLSRMLYTGVHTLYFVVFSIILRKCQWQSIFNT